MISININKIAWLRNARDGDIPNLVDMTMNIIDSGCDGITVHPRPDLRHITPEDVYTLRELTKRKKVEFIETLLPLIAYQNQQILVERERLFKIQNYLLKM